MTKSYRLPSAKATHGGSTHASMDSTPRGDLTEPGGEARAKRVPDDEPFLAAFQALLSGDLSKLQTLLRAHPELATERGTNGNTLLNLAVSLAGKPDGNGSTAAIEALLAHSDVNEANDRGWTPLHQAAYADQVDIAALLIARGAALDAEAYGAGGTPLIAALFWGNREVADLLGRHSVAPGNLRAAAGLGIPELVEACFTSERSLFPRPARPEASTVRTMGSRTGIHRLPRKRSLMKPWFGRARAIAWRCWNAWCERGRDWTPTHIGEPR